MKIRNLIITAALAMICAPAMPALTAAAKSKSCKGLSGEIIKYARANKINKIAVLRFTAGGGAADSEAYFVSEKINAYLAGGKKTARIERASLEKALKDANLASAAGDQAAGASTLRDIFAVDAVVTGTVFAAGEKLKILARLNDMRTGRVLLAAEAETGRERQDSKNFLSMELPGFPGPYPWGDTAELPLPPADFRDSVANPENSSCPDRRLRLTELNSELLDAKARYWAAKMKEPGFSLRSFSKNPGIEIGDLEIKAGFYRLLAAYYKTGDSALTEPDKLAAVLDLMEMETRFLNECGAGQSFG